MTARRGLVRYAVITLVAVAALASTTAPAFAATVNWGVNASGFWDDAASWTSKPDLPGADDDVAIDQAGHITVTHRIHTTMIKSLSVKETLAVTGGTLTVTGPTNLFGLVIGGGTLTALDGLSLVDLSIDLASGVGLGRLDVSGPLCLCGPGIDFDLGFVLSDSLYTFRFLHADGEILGFDPSAFTINGNYAGYNAELVKSCAGSACDVDLRLTRIENVPEPATLLLLTSGLAGLAATAWRARRRT